MTVKIMLDTKLLRSYLHSPNNYSHFLTSNLVEVYTVLEREGLLDEELEIYTNNPSERFCEAYEIFGRYAGRKTAPGDTHLTFQPEHTIKWMQETPGAGYARLKRFAALVRDRLEVPDVPGNLLTYVCRPPRLLGRYFANEDAVIRTLTEIAARHSLEFRAVKLEHETFDSQVRLMAQTRMLIGLHGAAFANVLFCSPRTDIVEIWPHPGFKYWKFEQMSIMLGMTHTHIHLNRMSAPNFLSILRLPVYFFGHNKNRVLRDRVIVADTDILQREVEAVLAVEHQS